MRFTKMHGAGNDYIYVNAFDERLPSDIPELARRMSDRHFGIGGDGLILIGPSEQADATMRMYNSDGTPAEMCGNGIRCVAKYVYEHGICRRDRLQIESGGEVRSLELTIDSDHVTAVRVDMGAPILKPADIPTTLRSPADPDAPICDEPLEIGGRRLAVTCVSMGNPHCVAFVDELTDDLVLGIGPQIETDDRFPQRVNVEFVQLVSSREVRQRTWERGSGETLACGTGASAVCVAGQLTGRTQSPLVAHLPGGQLTLEWSGPDQPVYMTGPATEVFTGEWNA